MNWIIMKKIEFCWLEKTSLKNGRRRWTEKKERNGKRRIKIGNKKFIDKINKRNEVM
jgi:hypothetical protein